MPNEEIKDSDVNLKQKPALRRGFLFDKNCIAKKAPAYPCLPTGRARQNFLL